jgi:hypothetical protein
MKLHFRVSHKEAQKTAGVAIKAQKSKKRNPNGSRIKNVFCKHFVLFVPFVAVVLVFV